VHSPSRALFLPASHRHRVPGSGDGPWGSPVVKAARALVAVGVIDADAAQAVVDDYHLAVQLRSEGGARRAMFRRARQARGAQRARGARPAPALKPRRVAACEQVIELSAGELRVRFVSLADDETWLSVVLWPVRSSRRAHRTMAPGRSRKLTLIRAGR
jgi:hypothetical protein